jgi:hypothetical protein
MKKWKKFPLVTQTFFRMNGKIEVLFHVALMLIFQHDKFIISIRVNVIFIVIRKSTLVYNL